MTFQSELEFEGTHEDDSDALNREYEWAYNALHDFDDCVDEYGAQWVLDQLSPQTVEALRKAIEMEYSV